MKGFNFKNIETPDNGEQVYRNHYWLCENGDTEKALFYGNSPQCNTNELICKLMISKKQYQGKNLEVVFVDLAFAPILL